MGFGFSTNNRKDGIIVPARSSKSIEDLANSLRKALDLESVKRFPVMELYELLHQIYPGSDFEVKFEDEMGEDHGRTFTDKNLIWIREDVYERAGNNEARDRFTMCHELGHLVMHKNIALSRIDPKFPPKTYCNSEWQADKFASYLLMPSNLLMNYGDIQEAMAVFGTSYSAVKARLKDMKKV